MEHGGSILDRYRSVRTIFDQWNGLRTLAYPVVSCNRVGYLAPDPTRSTGTGADSSGRFECLIYTKNSLGPGMSSYGDPTRQLPTSERLKFFYFSQVGSYIEVQESKLHQQFFCEILDNHLFFVVIYEEN
jgi:hypothetical protein